MSAAAPRSTPSTACPARVSPRCRTSAILGSSSTMRILTPRGCHPSTSSSIHSRRIGSPLMKGTGTVVEARGLVKRYGEITAVDDVDLTVPAGDVYGLLGPN